MKKTLIIGYGNIDRQDDGLAWHILLDVAQHFDHSGFEIEQEFFEFDKLPHLLFELQLMPELAEMIRNYDQVIFVDAHTGTVEQEINWTTIQPQYKPSAFTHHMSPETCLSLTQTLYGATPAAILVSVRGYEFGFGDQLSQRSAQLAREASAMIINWLENGY